MKEGMKKMIEENVIAFATSNKKPHVIAVGDVKVLSDNKLLIGDNFMKTTIENIKNNNKVSLAVWNNETGYNLEGRAEYFTKGEYLDMIKKIHKGYPAKGAILVTINKVKVLS